MRVLTVFGTRPCAVKMSPLLRKLKECPEIDALCCVTGQHREMLDAVLEKFNIKPDIDLNIMTERQTLADITSRTLVGMVGALDELKPDLVLVHGDTSTSFAAALAAFYAKIPVGHVEAGLRTDDRYSPFPEEMNRRMTSRVASLHFCPTSLNAENLRREGITDGVYITGNTVIDALNITVSNNYEFESAVGAIIGRPQTANTKRLILATVHRRENYNDLEGIFRAFADILTDCPDTELVLPVHLSPIVRDAANAALADIPRARLIEPINVWDMHNLMARSTLVLTDSGGLQEEAPALGKPVLVLRRETERPEAVEAGTVKLVGVERETIVREAKLLLNDKSEYEKMAKAVNPYGDGKASERIVEIIRNLK
ncbi:MAG: UDP-N-acetylglucosamine 2-epimerase (non-hydrolyzing) [Oscillospiraceae bacterium]|nr:UDP-N-acetylglucosamine 2-epimerase (non-hydrolyzing) [Oscillospiraceae bacterium]